VANDEPYLPAHSQLEDYPPTPAAEPGVEPRQVLAPRPLAHRVLDGARRVRSRQREEGWSAAVAAVGRTVDRAVRRWLSGTR
jgi:hypothetical protein